MPFNVRSTVMPQLTGAYASAVPGLAQLGIAQRNNERERLRAAIREFGASRARKRAERRGGEGDAAGGAAAGAASGASVGTAIVPGWGTLIGAAVGAIAGGVAGHNIPKGGGPVPGGGGGMAPRLTDLGPIIAQIVSSFKRPPGKEGEDWRQIKLPGEGGDEEAGSFLRSTGGMPTQVNSFASWMPGAVTGANPFQSFGLAGTGTGAESAVAAAMARAAAG